MVKNEKRGRGRPRGFDERVALDAAVGLFWTKGFDATSLDDLSAAMGIARPSLYCAFGDKEALFLRCLTHYAETVSSRAIDALEQEGPIRQAMARYLTTTVENGTCDPAHRGCLLGSVAGATESSRVREFLAASIQRREDRVAQRLRSAVETGELPPDFPVRRRARRAIQTMMALGSRARLGTPVAELLEDAEDGVSVILD